MSPRREDLVQLDRLTDRADELLHRLEQTLATTNPKETRP